MPIVPIVPIGHRRPHTPRLLALSALLATGWRRKPRPRPLNWVSCRMVHALIAVVGCGGALRLASREAPAPGDASAAIPHRLMCGGTRVLSLSPGNKDMVMMPDDPTGAAQQAARDLDGSQFPPPPTVATEARTSPPSPPKVRHRKRAPSLKLAKQDGAVSIDVDHPDPAAGWAMIMDAIGTDDPGFLRAFVSQIFNAGTKGQGADEQGAKFLMAVVQSIEPRDELEAMLAAQMAAVHMATMTVARRVAQVETIAMQDSTERAFNKLARTFAVQMEALKRYRTGGEQKVTVQHVTVNEGGQAIVGAVGTPRPGGGG